LGSPPPKISHLLHFFFFFLSFFSFFLFRCNTHQPPQKKKPGEPFFPPKKPHKLLFFWFANCSMTFPPPPKKNGGFGGGRCGLRGWGGGGESPFFRGKHTGVGFFRKKPTILNTPFFFFLFCFLKKTKTQKPQNMGGWNPFQSPSCFHPPCCALFFNTKTTWVFLSALFL